MADEILPSASPLMATATLNPQSSSLAIAEGSFLINTNQLQSLSLKYMLAECIAVLDSRVAQSTMFDIFLSLAVAGPINKDCPVTGDPLGKEMVVSQYKGETVGFCCDDCKDAFVANPSRFPILRSPTLPSIKT
eukprot:g3804.t1